MLIPLTAAFLSSTIAREMLRWLRHLGGPGLIILSGLLDSSIIPIIPGSLDALTIVLAAAKLEVWPYYAFMATTGSVLGAYLTYRLARNQGEAALTNRLSRRNVERVNKFFAKWGLGAIVMFPQNSSASRAHGSVRSGCRCDEISGQEVLDCFHSGPGHPLYVIRISGSHVRAAYPEMDIEIWRLDSRRGTRDDDCSDSHRSTPLEKQPKEAKPKLEADWLLPAARKSLDFVSSGVQNIENRRLIPSANSVSRVIRLSTKYPSDAKS